MDPPILFIVIYFFHMVYFFRRPTVEVLSIAANFSDSK
jgi:hypothetical protein